MTKNMKYLFQIFIQMKIQNNTMIYFILYQKHINIFLIFK
jgi:hypothetical protein